MRRYIFCLIGDHTESNVRVCAALERPETITAGSRGARAPVPPMQHVGC